MSPEAGRLSDVAARVADGAAVDWDRAERDGDAEERRLIGHLRLVDSIAGLYRSIPAEPGIPDLDDATGSIAGEAWGPLVILERLGQGSSCEVLRAFEKTLHREVALKLFHPGDVAAEEDGRGLAEARRLARVRHTNVVQVFGVEQHNGRAGIWMELIRGDSLDAIVAGRGRLGAGEAARIGEQVCQALSAVHAAGLVHRDIKAQNIVRESGGRIVLMDFGTGQDLRHGLGSASLAGTPLYLAPEIFAGKPATVRSDIYSLGVLLFYLTTGEFPITGATMDELRAQHAAGDRRRLQDRRPDLPAGFAAVVDRALASDHVDRFATAGELAAALHEWAQDQRDPEVVPRPWPRLARARLLLVLGLVGLIAAAGLTWRRIALATAPIRSVAVLPPTDLSGGQAPADYASGVHDRLLDTLGQISTLNVSSRTSSVAVGGGTRTVDEIARLLNVDAVVESTLTVGDDDDGGGQPTVRLGIRLVQAGGDRVLLSQYFERPLGEAMRLQRDAATAIAECLHALKDGAPAPQALRGPADPQVTDALFKAHAALNRYGPRGAEQALALFNRILARDPQNAEALIGAAKATIALQFNQTMSRDEARAVTFAQATQALTIDPDLPEAHLVLGDVLLFYDWNLRGAADEYKQALSLNRSSVVALKNYADVLAARGDLEQGLAKARQAAVLDPQSAETAVNLGNHLLYGKRYGEADEAYDRALELNAQSIPAMIGKGRVAEARRHFDKALAYTDEAIRQSNGGSVPLWIQRACLLAKAGRVSEARTALAEIERTQAALDIPVPPEYRAYLQVALGEHADALGLLEEAVALRSPSIIWMASDPRLDPLRNHPRFKAMVERMNP